MVLMEPIVTILDTISTTALPSSVITSVEGPSPHPEVTKTPHVSQRAASSASCTVVCHLTLYTRGLRVSETNTLRTVIATTWCVQREVKYAGAVSRQGKAAPPVAATDRQHQPHYCLPITAAVHHGRGTTMVSDAEYKSVYCGEVRTAGQGGLGLALTQHLVLGVTEFRHPSRLLNTHPYLLPIVFPFQP